MFGGIWLGALRPPAAAPASYDFTLTDEADDGAEFLGSGTFSSFTGSSFVYEANGSANGRLGGSYVMGLSFPAVNLTTCSAATLTLEQQLDDVGGTVRVYGHKNSARASQRWANSFLISTYFGEATTAFQNSTVTGVGTRTIDVAAIVQEIMGGAFWASGNRINLWLEAITANAFGLYGDPGSPPAPRLQITG